MTTTSETKSETKNKSEIKIYAKRFRENNQQVCIDCLKTRSNKNKFECKNFGCTEFCVLDYQNSVRYFKMLTVCNV